MTTERFRYQTRFLAMWWLLGVVAAGMGVAFYLVGMDWPLSAVPAVFSLYLFYKGFQLRGRVLEIGEETITLGSERIAVAELDGVTIEEVSARNVDGTTWNVARLFAKRWVTISAGGREHTFLLELFENHDRLRARLEELVN